MTTSKPTDIREFELDNAKGILREYALPNSMIDNGNLFFAATEYQGAYEQLKVENEKLKDNTRMDFADIMKLREQVKDYEQALKDLKHQNNHLITEEEWRIDEVLKKWSEI